MILGLFYRNCLNFSDNTGAGVWKIYINGMSWYNSSPISLKQLNEVEKHDFECKIMILMA